MVVTNEAVSHTIRKTRPTGEIILTSGFRAWYNACNFIQAMTKTEQREAPQRAGYGANRRAEASSHPF
jgi:hypothetical protein